ncbi:MAG: Acyl-CoA dehydrogenase [Rhodocyclaceae bacterium]|nr:Acyl-CoA dehydrogenase [Rhodocyclaceae bacterium]
MSQEDTNQMLRDAVGGFAARDTSIARVRALRETDPGFDRAVWKKIADAGWTGILVPEKFGGAGLSLPEMAAVLEEFAKTLSPEPLNAVSSLAALTLSGGDNEALQARLLPQIAAGDLIAAVAWQESESGIDPAAIETTAKEAAGGYALSGSKRFAVPFGADAYLVSAKGQGGVIVACVDKSAKGLTVDSELRADGTRVARLKLDNVQVAKADIVASAGAGARALGQAIDQTTILAGAELLGVMSRALEITLDYMRTRVQFDRPIGSFQALQHRAVDLFIQKELSFSVLRDAHIHLAQDADALALWASRVKSRCSEAGMRIGRESIQIHGGIGFTDECDIGLYLKRAMVLSAWLGNGAVHRRRYAALAPALEAA